MAEFLFRPHQVLWLYDCYITLVFGPLFHSFGNAGDFSIVKLSTTTRPHLNVSLKQVASEILAFYTNGLKLYDG
jgi:hypothetical protein